MNDWVATQKRRTLTELRAEVDTLRAAASKRDNKHCQHNAGQRRMATRILTLIDLKLSVLGDEQARERAERADSQSADDIDEGLKA